MAYRRLLFIPLAGLLAVSGCKTASDTYVSPTELVTALLTVDELGTDWRENQRDAFDERAQENPVIDTGQFCADGLSTASTLESLAGQSGADVEMQVKESTRMLRLQAWSNADVDEFFSAARSAARACDNQEWTDAQSVAYSFDVVDGPDIGDDVFHWKLLASPPAEKPEKMFGVAGRTSVARFGNVLMLLEIGDYAPDAASQILDTDKWAKIVSMAGAKIDALSSNR